MRDETRSPGADGSGRDDPASVPPAGGDDSIDTSPDPEAEAARRILIEGFTPVPPDPAVWDAIVAATLADPSRVDDVTPAPPGIEQRERSHRWTVVLSVAALLLVVVGSAAFMVSRTVRDPSAAALVRELVDPGTGETAMTIRQADDGRASATLQTLPPLDAGSTYQLWSVVGDEIVSVALLGEAPHDVEFRIEGEPAVLALTVEPAGGVAVSTQQPVAVWQATG
jgi:hypothetical protein